MTISSLQNVDLGSAWLSVSTISQDNKKKRSKLEEAQ